MGHLLYWTLLLGVVAATCGFRVSDRDNEISLTVDDENSLEEALHSHSWHEEFAANSQEQEEDVRTWFQCPPQEDGVFPNPRNCSSFVQCSNGIAHVMACPKELHYSTETKRCERHCEAYCNVTLSCSCKWPTCDLPKQCFLPKETGPCRGSIPRYFFNKRNGECEKFLYGGCPGNSNNFETKEACEKTCTKVVTNVCHLPKEVGPCKGNFPRYFFDKVTKKCEKFVYGGCQGNENNFLSIEACERRCAKEIPQVCSLPKLVGPCKAKMPRYFFNEITKKCENFFYGGCQGNENNFVSKEECEKKCIVASSIDDFAEEYSREISSSREEGEDFKPWFQCPPKQNGMFPNPRNCSSFVQCSNGIAHVMPCPKGLHYSAETQRCEEECKAYCNQTLSCKCEWPTCDLPKQCFLPKETGPCRGSIPRYFFNKRKGECEKFLYGGCPGNSNNFETKEACEKTCTKVVTNVCHLPKEVGPCKGSLPRYFFDKVTKKCEKFVYGGCQGNENNFLTIEACERRCAKVDDESSIEQSFQEQSWNEEISTSQEEDVRPIPFKCLPEQNGMFPNPRNCSSFVQCSNGIAHVMPCPKGLNYNAETKRCDERCNAYCNRTLSCECKWPTCGLPRVCFLPKQSGICHASIPRYFFNKRTGECEKFIYGGCQGNPNNFESKEVCEKRCTKVNQPDEEISSADEKFEAKFQCPPKKNGLYPNPRNCSTFVQCSNGIAHVMPCPERLHYSTKTMQCEEKCKAFCNQTLSCECKWPTCGLPAMCFLPSKTGPCRAGFQRWFFNKRSGQCEKFVYGGCRGNANNFDTKESCQKICKKQTEESAIEQPRQQSWNEEILTSSAVEFTCPQKNGIFKNPSDCKTFYQCSNWTPYLMQCAAELHYSEATKKCEYPCVACCNSTIVCPKGNCDRPTVCMLPKEVGPCHASFSRYYFDKSTGECEKFIYGGCQGNANNFLTKVVCEMRCKKVEPTVCQLPKVVGPCRGSIPRYFFNKRTEKCEKFIYGGCEGNANNFETIEACEKRCTKVESSIEQSSQEQSWNEEISTSQEEDVRPIPFRCLPEQDGLFPNPRNCSSFIQCSNGITHVMSCPKGLHYSAETKRCEEECNAYCNQTLSCKCKWPTCDLPKQCFLPKVSGTCHASFVRYFFNKRNGKCEVFTYGGCGGNSNNFDTIEACVSKCQKVVRELCDLPKIVGPCRGSIPRYFFNKRTQKCEKFVYGGCEGNANNFETIEACEKRCPIDHTY